MGGSSGSGQPQQVTQTTSNLPEYARPYFENLLDRTNNVTQQQYTPYTGQRLAGQNNWTTTSDTMTAGMTGRQDPTLNSAHASLDWTGQQAGALGGYQSGYQASGYTPHQINGGVFDQNAANQYMSPYMQSVVDRQKDAATLDFQRGQAGRDDSAIRANAFGGSRQAIQQGLAQQGLQRQLGDIQAQGSQSAFTNAQAQFNADQGRGLDAQRATEQSHQFGATFGDSAQRYAEDSLRNAAGIRAGAANLGLQTAQGYGALASTDQSLGLQQAQAVGNIGNRLTQRDQQGLDIGYNDFVNQRDYDRQNLNFYSGILRGTPVSADSETRKYDNPNPLNQIAGAGIAGLAAYRATQ
jgi:hypothetical protein